MTQDQIIQELKKSVTKLVAQGVLKRLVAALPFFGWPVIGPIITHILTKFVATAIDELDNLGYSLFINYKKNEQAKTFEKAAQTNEEIQKHGTKEEKERAEQALIDAARNLIRYRS